MFCISFVALAFRRTADECQRFGQLALHFCNGPHVRPVYRNFAIRRREVKQGLLELF